MHDHDVLSILTEQTPTPSDFQENPTTALSKGWSLFSAAVIGASPVRSKNIIQPSVEKVSDPIFQATVKGYMTEARKRASIVGSAGNEWSTSQLGVDVAESMGGVVDTVKDMIGAGPPRAG